MTKLLCSCLSRANVNIWRANVVSSQEMSTGIRGGQACSITCATTSLGLSCDVMEPTWLQCALSTAWALEETLKAMKMIDCMTLGRMSSHKITSLFQISKRSCNLPVSHFHIWFYNLKRSKCKAGTSLVAYAVHLISIINADNRWWLMTFLKAGIKATYCISAFFLHLDAMRESRFYSSKSQETQEQLVEWNGEAQPEGNNICSLWRLSSAVWAKRMATYVEMSVLDLFFFSAWHCNIVVLLC